MANEYATLDQAKTRIANKLTEGDETELGEILEAASRAIDDYLEVQTGHFSPAPEEVFTKTLRGTGETFIDLPAPLYGEVAITAEDGITIPNFTVEGLRLITLDASGFPRSWIVWREVYYSVEGNWGYPATPPQLREACLQLVVHFWRGRDKALTGTIMDMRQDEQFPERDFPRMTRRILDDFKYNLAPATGGGGLILA